MSFRILITAIAIFPFLCACSSTVRGSDQLRSDIGRGKLLLERNALVTEALEGKKGKCCWIKVEKWFDGNRVREGSIYTTSPIEKELSIYILSKIDYYTYHIDHEEIMQFYETFSLYCLKNIRSENFPIIHVYYENNYIECTANESILRMLPH